MVNIKMVKPQKVKAWAKPGTVQRRSLRWPPTSDSSAHARARNPVNRFGSGRPFPIKAEEVGETATGDGEGDDGHAQAEGDPDGQRLLLEGQGRKFSKYRLGVGPRWPWYFEPRPAVP